MCYFDHIAFFEVNKKFFQVLTDIVNLIQIKFSTAKIDLEKHRKIEIHKNDTNYYYVL